MREVTCFGKETIFTKYTLLEADKMQVVVPGNFEHQCNDEAYVVSIYS